MTQNLFKTCLTFTSRFFNQKTTYKIDTLSRRIYSEILQKYKKIYLKLHNILYYCEMIKYFDLLVIFSALKFEKLHLNNSWLEAKIIKMFLNLWWISLQLDKTWQHIIKPKNFTQTFSASSIFSSISFFLLFFNNLKFISCLVKNDFFSVNFVPFLTFAHNQKMVS